MAPGEYEFGTTEHERVRVTSGVLKVKLPGEDDLQTVWSRQRIPGRRQPKVPADRRTGVGIPVFLYLVKWVSNNLISR